MTFSKTVLAYLTGWLIAQPVYNRLWAAWRRRQMRNPSEEMRFYWREQAKAIVDEWDDRAGGRFTGEQLRMLMRFAHLEGWHGRAAPRGAGLAEPIAALVGWTPEKSIDRFMSDPPKREAFNAMPGTKL